MLAADFHPRMMEYFKASGRHPPLDECMAQVSGSRHIEASDVLIVIVAHRYGWVPEDQPPPATKSITRLECEEAVRGGREVLAFIVDDETDWPGELREESTLVKAMRDNAAQTELFEETSTRIRRLNDFKEWLSTNGIRRLFTSPESLHGEIVAALAEWRKRQPECGAAVEQSVAVESPAAYLRYLQKRCSHIDVRGMHVGKGTVHRMPIGELFVPLMIDNPAQSDCDSTSEEFERIGLKDALINQHLLITGDPGSGKTTFLRWIVSRLCEQYSGDDAIDISGIAAIADSPLPCFVRISELAQLMMSSAGARDAPSALNSPAWLPYYLETRCKELNFELSAEYFRKRLHDGSAILLLDGLDEAPTHSQRSILAELLDHAVDAYDQTPIVVTSRPAILRDEVALQNYTSVAIAPLDNGAVESFLARWTEILHAENTSAAREHCQELLGAVRSRPEIWRMARNPVMLTALAVVHWNEKRIPEQRAELYDSVLRWLLRSRQHKANRPTADRSLKLHQRLALSMQDAEGGRRTQVSRRWAAEQLADALQSGESQDRLTDAERFLLAEELDSGIVVSRGSDVRFWHLTFQEFLAARAIAAQSDQSQRDLLLGQSRIHDPAWREVVLLLAGVLHQQGDEKLDGMCEAIIDAAGEKPDLLKLAAVVGLLSSFVKDLSPFEFRPRDPRFEEMLRRTLVIFDNRQPEPLPLRVAVETAEALGRAGDPRFCDPAHTRHLL